MSFAFSRSRAPRTTELYQTCWKDWSKFCAETGATPLPALAETVLEFLHRRKRDHSTSALSARKAAIIAAHVDARSRLPDNQREPYKLDHNDTLKLGWKEILREKGNRHTPREAVGGVRIKEVLKHIPDTLAGKMDKAILLIGLACAMRRSEIAALNVDDLDFPKDGKSVRVTIRRSKTDQSGNGVTLAAPFTGTEACPVTALKDWLKASKITEGPLFQHPRYKTPRRIDDTLPYILMKKYGKLAFGENKLLGAHSLRRGCITDIHEAGVDSKSGMLHSRHVTANIYFGYVAGKEAEKNPAVAALAKTL